MLLQQVAGALNESALSVRSLGGLLGRLEDESLVNVRDHTTASDGGLDQGVKLLVTSDGELKVSRSNSFHLKVL